MQLSLPLSRIKISLWEEGNRMLKALIKVKDALLNIYLWVAAAMLAVLILSCLIQVVARYLLPSSPPWTEELARFAFIWSSSLGAAVALERGLHAAITVVVDRMPVPLRNVVRVLTLLIILALSGLIGWSGALLSIATRATPSPSLRLPMIYVHSAVVFCGLGMGISALCSLFGKKDITGGGAE
ncbi:TRAP transporter small permease [bacterium 1xD42-67]|nr:TRAP transporter small permease [bacterium 1xD42-67]